MGRRTLSASLGWPGAEGSGEGAGEDEEVRKEVSEVSTAEQVPDISLRPMKRQKPGFQFYDLRVRELKLAPLSSKRSTPCFNSTH